MRIAQPKRVGLRNSYEWSTIPSIKKCPPKQIETHGMHQHPFEYGNETVLHATNSVHSVAKYHVCTHVLYQKT